MSDTTTDRFSALADRVRKPLMALHDLEYAEVAPDDECEHQALEQAQSQRLAALGELEQAAREAHRHLRDAPLGGDGSHWQDCWRSHIDCAEARVEALTARVAELEAALREIATGEQP